MTVRMLVNFLLGLDPEMEVAILDADDEIAPVCGDVSEVIEMEDPETNEKEEVLLLVPCYGHEETEPENIDTVNPILN